MIPKSEFARRLCIAAHFRQSQVPCGQHVAEAERYWFLIGPGGEKVLDIIRQARIDGRVDKP